jgi:hypothetical protein
MKVEKIDKLNSALGIYVRGNEGYPRFTRSVSKANITEEDIIKLFDETKEALIKFLKEDGVI